jgi:glycosyltransferase involved in cell wall biosynthesis
MSNILLSIVISSFNRSKHLERCLYSIEQQIMDTSKFEVIIVDNNSSDTTPGIIYPFLHRNAHFKFYRETNSGFHHTRNRGLKQAIGQYVAFIQDDVILPMDWCIHVLNSFESVSPAPALVTGAVSVWLDQDPPDWFYRPMEEKKLSGELGFVTMNSSVTHYMDAHLIVDCVAYEQQTGTKFSFKRGYQKKLTTRGLISEDQELLQVLFMILPIVWYNPYLMVYRFIDPRQFSFHSQVRHAYYQAKYTSVIDTYRQFFAKLLHAIILTPVILIGYPFRLFFPRQTWLLKRVQSFAKDIGIMVKFSHTKRNRKKPTNQVESKLSDSETMSESSRVD